MSVVTTPVGEDKCRVQRGYSWRLSRPSLRKKKQRTGSDSDAVILNNGRDHAVCNGKFSGNIYCVLDKYRLLSFLYVLAIKVGY